MPSVIIHPRGYTRQVSAGTGIVRSTGDAEVNQIYDELIQRQSNMESWDFRKRAMLLGVRVFNEFFRWAMDQQNNSAIQSYNYDFLVDTLNFINTGKRQLTTVNWLYLVSEESYPNRGANMVRQHPLPLGMFNNKSEEVVSKWVGQPDGLEDMITSMFVLFGRSVERD